MNCENCGNYHDGNYGSGRFCSTKCARGFSTKNNRDEINKKVSRKLLGHKNPPGVGFQKGHDLRRKDWTLEDRIKAQMRIRENRQRFAETAEWIDLSNNQRRIQVLKEQNECCYECGIKEWNDKALILELDHIDGYRQNNSRENLRLLCPNCHSQTPTFRARNIRNRVQISDAMFKQALDDNVSVRAALIQLGLTPSAGNYARAHKLNQE